VGQGRVPPVPCTAPAGSSAPLWTPTFVLACLTNFVSWAAGYLLFSTVALYAVQLGAPVSHVGWFSAISTFGGLAAQLAAGRWLRHQHRTALLRRATVVLIVTPILPLVVPTAPALLAFCLIYGAGYGMLQSVTVVLATEAAPPARRGQAIGIYGTFTTLAVLISPPTGVLLLQRVGGAAVFAAMLLLGVVTLMLALRTQEPARAREPATFERRRLHPLVYFAALTLMGMTATWGTLLTFLPVYALDLGLTNPGLYFSVQAAGVLTLRMLSGRLSDRFGRLQVLVPGTLLVALGVWGLALHPAVPSLLLLALLYGFGYATIHPASLALAADVSTGSTRSTALVLVGSTFGVGVAAGAVLMGFVLGRSSYETMFLVAGLLPVLATGALVWQWRAHGRKRALASTS
jgi:MFS family permease